MDFILASASPRRKELLETVGLKFRVITSDADEGSVSSEGVPVGIYVQELALIKAAAVAKSVLKNKKALIIAADTVVTLDGKILGKPRDAEDAFNMLKSLSGREHEVYTGICLMRVSDGKTYCTSQSTKVYFKDLTDEQIRAYIATGEPMDKSTVPIWYTEKPRYYWEDKAGGYGIQHPFGMKAVERIEGDYYNVVGLPISKLCQVLKAEFDIEV